MPDYSTYSMGDLERAQKVTLRAYVSLDCPGYFVPCDKCGINDDCTALRRMLNNIETEMRNRRVRFGSHGEEKENRS